MISNLSQKGVELRLPIRIIVVLRINGVAFRIGIFLFAMECLDLLLVTRQRLKAIFGSLLNINVVFIARVILDHWQF
jgi:hypothetical protein